MCALFNLEILQAGAVKELRYWMCRRVLESVKGLRYWMCRRVLESEEGWSFLMDSTCDNQTDKQGLYQSDKEVITCTQYVFG